MFDQHRSVDVIALSLPPRTDPNSADLHVPYRSEFARDPLSFVQQSRRSRSPPQASAVAYMISLLLMTVSNLAFLLVRHAIARRRSSQVECIFRPPDIGQRKHVRFGAAQGGWTTVAAVFRSVGEPGKASPIRGGGHTAKCMRR